MDEVAFGRYRLLSVIGEGGMGTVYKARDTATNRIVAIKLLPPHLAQDNTFAQRFRREAEAAAKLNNPHIIPIHTYGEIDGRLYVDMRLIEGRDLAQVLADAPLEPGRAVPIIEQVAKALHAAHKIGLVHRDVKPSNILLDEDDFAYLIDFGIAHGADQTKLTSTGSTIGTWAYMAPERMGARDVDARADIYALACVLYECLTGSPPFPGDTMESQVAAHLTAPPPLPSSGRPWLSEHFDPVIEKGMAKDPNARHATTLELAHEARDAIATPIPPNAEQSRQPATLLAGATRAAPSRKVTDPLRPQVPPPHPDAEPPPATGTLQAGRSNRKWLIAAAVVVLIAASVMLHSVLSSKPANSELMLTASTDPGPNPFMTPAASPPPTNTKPEPTLQPQGNGPVVTQPLPGDRDGLYGGTMNNAECDRDRMINFLSTHAPQANAFVEALNTDPTLFWSGGRPLTADDIPTYLRELTPTVLRLDTRVTNHGFDGTHPTTLQSVLQAGTAVFVDAHGVPRARCYCGNPLTAPTALTGQPKPVGTPWVGYNPRGLADVQPSKGALTNFVLFDVVSGQFFNRPAGTTGSNDTPHTQPVPPPSAVTTPTSGQGPQRDIDGTYVINQVASGCVPAGHGTATITHQGNSLTLVMENGDVYTGTLSADGAFMVSNGYSTRQGVFATEGGRTVIRDGILTMSCGSPTFTGAKQ